VANNDQDDPVVSPDCQDAGRDRPVMVGEFGETARRRDLFAAANTAHEVSRSALRSEIRNERQRMEE